MKRMWEYTFSYTDIAGMEFKHIYRTYVRAILAFKFHKMSRLTQKIDKGLRLIPRNMKANYDRIIIMKPFWTSRPLCIKLEDPPNV